MRSRRLRAVAWMGLAIAVVTTGCAPAAEPPRDPEDGTSGIEAPAEQVLARAVAEIDRAAASVDSVFQPLPLLRPAEEQELRRFLAGDQLVRARALGVGRGLSEERIEELRRDGRLVPLRDGDHYVVREMDYSQPLAVPGVHALLTEIGVRFHARLADLGAPPFRIEISSALRTSADQAALRRVNPNAALGESTHEYGTTVDLLYSAFAAPAHPIVELDASAAPWLEPYLRRHADVAAERVAGRRALELKAILGQVLLEMQREGAVMVTLERLQPVYHITLARAL